MERVRRLPAYLGWRVAWAATALVAAMLLALPPVHAAPRQAPAFTLELFDGTTFRLADRAGSAVVLLFWAPW